MTDPYRSVIRTIQLLAFSRRPTPLLFLEAKILTRATRSEAAISPNETPATTMAHQLSGMGQRSFTQRVSIHVSPTFQKTVITNEITTI